MKKKTKRSRATYRFNFDFTQEGEEKLIVLAERWGKTRSEIIRIALDRLYFMDEEQQRGNKIGVVRDGKVIQEILFC